MHERARERVIRTTATAKSAGLQNELVSRSLSVGTYAHANNRSNNKGSQDPLRERERRKEVRRKSKGYI